MAGHSPINVLNTLADIMYHESSAVKALDLLLNAIGPSGPGPEGALAVLASSSNDLGSATAAVEALE
jgi:hypothetical protein